MNVKELKEVLSTFPEDAEVMVSLLDAEGDIVNDSIAKIGGSGGAVIIEPESVSIPL